MFFRNYVSSFKWLVWVISRKNYVYTMCIYIKMSEYFRRALLHQPILEWSSYCEGWIDKQSGQIKTHADLGNAMDLRLVKIGDGLKETKLGNHGQGSLHYIFYTSHVMWADNCWTNHYEAVGWTQQVREFVESSWSPNDQKGASACFAIIEVDCGYHRLQTPMRWDSDLRATDEPLMITTTNPSLSWKHIFPHLVMADVHKTSTRGSRLKHKPRANGFIKPQPARRPLGIESHGDLWGWW